MKEFEFKENEWFCIKKFKPNKNEIFEVVDVNYLYEDNKLRVGKLKWSYKIGNFKYNKYIKDIYHITHWRPVPHK